MAVERRTYQDRKEYQREYQKRWRATPKGQSYFKSLERKRGPALKERRRIIDEGNKIAAFKSFREFFNHYDPVVVLPQIYITDPTFRVNINGKRYTEWLGQPLPTWTDSTGATKGGQKWDGETFS